MHEASVLKPRPLLSCHKYTTIYHNTYKYKYLKGGDISNAMVQFVNTSTTTNFFSNSTHAVKRESATTFPVWQNIFL